jgi:uncharacterized membrane protein (UPF0127 family)
MLIQFVTERGNSAPTRKSEQPDMQYASTFREKVVGLMFRKDFLGKMIFKFPQPCTLIVHTFFMRFAIHIRFYNKNHLVRECDMKPWRTTVVRNVDCFVEEKSTAHGK